MPQSTPQQWETLLKPLLKRLEIPTRDDINRLHTRLDRLEKLIYQQNSGRLPPGDALPARKNRIASNVVLEIIAGCPDGCNFKTIRNQTGYKDKKLRNIIYRLDKLGKIKRKQRGTYQIIPQDRD